MPRGCWAHDFGIEIIHYLCYPDLMFEFDPEKSAANLAKHGIDFEVAQALWQAARFAEGPASSPEEDRWMRVAMLDGKLWSAIFTIRVDQVRLISVRRSRPKEVHQYERENDFG